MSDRLARSAMIGGGLLVVLVLALTAFRHPVYVTDSTYLGGAVVAECLIVALWFYRSTFFPLVLMAFLLAGVDLPVGGGWNMGRWAVLATGAVAGVFLMLKERRQNFAAFHAVALFAVLAGMASTIVSRYPGFALSKALSFLLLFAYAGTGVRVAFTGRENQFFRGLLIGCEGFVVLLAVAYMLGREVMGNPNSLGAVMAVVAPILLWGVLIDDRPGVHHRRLLIYALSMFLLFYSRSRISMAAGALACAVLCLALRKYKMLAQGTMILVILITSAAILDPAFSRNLTSLTTSVVYKEQPGQPVGVLASRRSPWEGAMTSIRKHLWFGSGFGTTDTGIETVAHPGRFSSSSDVTTENGSSYLTIVSWVGVLGALPFLLLLLILLNKVFRTVLWMIHSGNPVHPAVPLAVVVMAGLIHAGFEDWLFAPGYYLCVFFWSLVFVLVDVAPWAPLPSPSLSLSLRSIVARPRGGPVAGYVPNPRMPG